MPRLLGDTLDSQAKEYQKSEYGFRHSIKSNGKAAKLWQKPTDRAEHATERGKIGDNPQEWRKWPQRTWLTEEGLARTRTFWPVSGKAYCFYPFVTSFGCFSATDFEYHGLVRCFGAYKRTPGQ
jgi:hypothetical protein